MEIIQAQFADEVGAQNRTLGELEIDVMPFEVAGSLGQCDAAHAGVLVGVRVIADREIESVVLGEKQLPGKIRVLVDGRTEDTLMDGARRRYGNDRSPLEVLMKVAQIQTQG